MNQGVKKLRVKDILLTYSKLCGTGSPSHRHFKLKNLITPKGQSGG